MTGLARPLLLPLAIGLLLAPGAARAQTFESGPYIGASAGAILLRDVEGSVGPADTTIEFAPGYDLAVQLGYRFSALRAELELEYARADLDTAEAAGVSVDADGELNILRGTGGLYLDFTLLPILTPYVGGGIGAAHVDGEASVVDGVTVDIEDDTHLTAHGEAGLAFDLPLLPVAIVPAYRYIWIDNGRDGFDDTTAHVIKLGARLEF